MDGPMTESLSVEDDSFHSIPLIRIRGALVYGHHLAAVRDACTRLTGTTPKRVIIDLRAVPSIDSSGLSALLDIKQILPNAEVLLLCPSDRVRATLDTMRVSELFTLVRTDSDVPNLDGPSRIPPVAPEHIP